jgi:predicted RecB family nuclease
MIPITSDIFEAFVKCPTKCWLRANGDESGSRAHHYWVRENNESHRETRAEQLHSAINIEKLTRSSAQEFISCNRWRYLIGARVVASAEACALECTLHAVEYAPTSSQRGLNALVPIRFHSSNKLHRQDLLLLGFDAVVLSKCLECSLATGKIVHGDRQVLRSVALGSISGTIADYISKIAALLSGSKPPELILNRHCPDCEFRHQCWQKALEIDDLSLLAGMSEKERARYRGKGIFTVRQLSYTFRSRRRAKRARRHTRLHSFALRALAIREGAVYIHGPLALPACETRVYLDIEGLPDRDFCYLIGALVATRGSQCFYSFWADGKSDEPSIFQQLADVIEAHPDCRVFHYGRYDSAVIRRVARSLPPSGQERLSRILDLSVNVLSLIHGTVYFPAYSNSLKDIVRTVHKTPDAQATGLDAIVWRMRWEQERNPDFKAGLIDYNRSDCISLMRLVEFVDQQIEPMTQQTSGGVAVHRTESLLPARPHWQLFAVKPYALEELKHVCKAAYFDYQRERVFFRTDPHFKRINKGVRDRNRFKLPKPTKVVSFDASRCPSCRSRALKRYGESSHDVLDLNFTRGGVRKQVTRFVSWRYDCCKCKLTFRSEQRLPNPPRYGHGFASWCAYHNSFSGLSMSGVRRGLEDIFGLRLRTESLERARDRLAADYEELCAEILAKILSSAVIHIDETTARLRKGNGYVWVLTTLDKVYYLYRPSRETDFLKDLLASFRGVLVSDFYSGYDALACDHQKCLVHFVRDIDDDLLRNPWDQELRVLSQQFGRLLKHVIASVDRFGLRQRYLRRHKGDVTGFLEEVGSTSYKSGVALRYKKRFDKYGSKMFTFLERDGVPWNNNNAEHAIKRFAKHRRDNDGRYSERTLKSYLVLATLFETCAFNNINVLKFLLSKERRLEGLLHGKTGEKK